MYNKKSLLFGLLGIGLVVIMAVIAVAFIGATRAGRATTTSTVSQLPSNSRGVVHPPTSVDGVPAIKPHLKGSGPTFTAADARAFVMANGIGRLEVRGPINVTLVVFGTAQQIQDRYTHFNLDENPDRLMCYVEIHNTIYTPHPDGAAGGPHTRGFAIFDAHTGNALGDGAF